MYLPFNLLLIFNTSTEMSKKQTCINLTVQVACKAALSTYVCFCIYLVCWDYYF